MFHLNTCLAKTTKTWGLGLSYTQTLSKLEVLSVLVQLGNCEVPDLKLYALFKHKNSPYWQIKGHQKDDGIVSKLPEVVTDFCCKC